MRWEHWSSSCGCTHTPQFLGQWNKVSVTLCKHGYSWRAVPKTTHVIIPEKVQVCKHRPDTISYTLLIHHHTQKQGMDQLDRQI
jgi:hypothetical protein